MRLNAMKSHMAMPKGDLEENIHTSLKSFKESDLFTDVNFHVYQDGQHKANHQAHFVVLAKISPLIRDLYQPLLCSCSYIKAEHERCPHPRPVLDLVLPDFSSSSVESVLEILYQGHCVTQQSSIQEINSLSNHLGLNLGSNFESIFESEPTVLPLECQVCGQKFGMSAALEAHLSKHPPSSCPMSSPVVQDPLENVVEMITDSSDEETTGITRTSVATDHVKSTTTTCYICEQNFVTNQLCQIHICKDHLSQKIMAIFPNSRTKCEICQKKLDSPSIAVIHLGIDHGYLEGIMSGAIKGQMEHGATRKRGRAEPKPSRLTQLQYKSLLFARETRTKMCFLCGTDMKSHKVLLKHFLKHFLPDILTLLPDGTCVCRENFASNADFHTHLRLTGHGIDALTDWQEMPIFFKDDPVKALMAKLIERGFICDASRKCLLCQTDLNPDDETLLEHMSVVHFKKPMLSRHNFEPEACIYCGQTFSDANQALYHFGVDHGVIVRICHVIDEDGTEVSSRKRPSASSDLSPKSKELKSGIEHSSPITRKSTVSTKQQDCLKSNPSTAKCPQCHKTFRQESHLKSHSITHYIDEILHKNNGGDSSTCNECGQGFQSQTHLARHLAFTHSYLDELIKTTAKPNQPSPSQPFKGSRRVRSHSKRRLTL